MDNSRPKSLPTCQHFSVGDLLYCISFTEAFTTSLSWGSYWLLTISCIRGYRGAFSRLQKGQKPLSSFTIHSRIWSLQVQAGKRFCSIGEKFSLHNNRGVHPVQVLSLVVEHESWGFHSVTKCPTIKIPRTRNSQWIFMLRHLSFFGYAIDCYTKTEGSDRKESLSQDCLLSTKTVLFFLRIIKKRPWKTNKMTTEAWAHREEYKYLGHFGVFLLIQKHWGPWRDIRASWITVSEAAKVGSWVHQQFLGSTWERWPISVFFWRCCFWGAYHQVYSVWLWLWAVVVVNFTVGCCRYLSLLLRRAWNTSTLRQLVFVEYMIVHDGNPYDQLTVPTITPAPAGVFYQSMDDEDHSDFGLIRLVASNIVAFWRSKYMTP